MAQGNFKTKKTAAPAKKQTALGLRKGSKVIAPKNKKMAAEHKATKKLSAGLAAKTERMLAEKAGHLEMLAGGKRSSKNAASQQKGAKPGAALKAKK